MNFLSKTIIIFCSIFFISCATGPKYLIENFSEYQEQHETVAILPVEVTISLANQARGITQEDIDRKAKDDSLTYLSLIHI